MLVRRHSRAADYLAAVGPTLRRRPVINQLAIAIAQTCVQEPERYGADVVCRATLEDAHLPEAKFRFTPLERLERPEITEHDADGSAPLVRRMLAKPEPLAGELEEGTRLDKVLVHAGERLTLIGPYRVSGGWWVREVMRDYYYARTPRGELWWIFYDHPRKAWFLHAYVD